jgi:hypothetical protein
MRPVIPKARVFLIAGRGILRGVLNVSFLYTSSKAGSFDPADRSGSIPEL